MQRSIGWGSENADPIRLGLSQRRPEPGPDRCSRVRFLGGAALNCWGGGAAQTASSGMADGSHATKVNHFYNGNWGVTLGQHRAAMRNSVVWASGKICHKVRMPMASLEHRFGIG